MFFFFFFPEQESCISVSNKSRKKISVHLQMILDVDLHGFTAGVFSFVWGYKADVVFQAQVKEKSKAFVLTWNSNQ